MPSNLKTVILDTTRFADDYVTTATNQTVTGIKKFGTETDYTTFDEYGTMVATGNATCFRDEVGPSTTIKTIGTFVTLDGAENTLDFTTNATLNDYAYVNVQINHDWKAGSDIKPHIHWEQRSSATPNWLVQYRWQRNGQAKTTAWTNYKCNTNAFTYTSGTLNQISYGAGITPPANYSTSDIFEMRVIRDMNNTSTVFTGVDTYSGDAELTSFDCHLEIDMLGSRTEYTK